MRTLQRSGCIRLNHSSTIRGFSNKVRKECCRDNDQPRLGRVRMTKTIVGPKGRSTLPRKGMPCKSNECSDGTLPFYSLTGVDCAAGPKSLDSLKRRLADWAKASNG